MEFFLSDPDVVRFPPKDIRLVDLQAEPYPDGKRIRVVLDLTPFQQKPYIDLNLKDSAGVIAATTSIVEPVTNRLELTLHIRRPPTDSIAQFTLSATLYYPDLGEVDHRLLDLVLPSPTQ
jgi:hypothetical protein